MPLSGGMPPRRFPIVKVALIVVNLAVWIFYELPHLNSSVYHASFYPCTVQQHSLEPEPWGCVIIDDDASFLEAASVRLQQVSPSSTGRHASCLG